QVQTLIPEGSSVEKGDTLVIFDRTELQKEIDDRLNELDIAQASYNKVEARLKAELRNMQSSLVADSTSWLLSKLRQERTVYESEMVRQEADLQFSQATLSYEKSRSNYIAQVGINAEELKEADLKIQTARDNLRKARKEYDDLVLTAPGPGMVVYLPVWLGGEPRKIKVGDQPWRGAGLIELPDFSSMRVTLQINEVDLNLVSLDDSVSVVLDAWPDRHFSGRITEVGVLAREKDGDSNTKVFDVTAVLDQRDPILKPGMNAQTTIFGTRIDEALAVPVEALFRDEQGWHVFRIAGKSIESVPVEVGPTDGDRMVVLSGLDAGDRLSLVDPANWSSEDAQ
ncbi:MAG: efflux RND transporter periplasmic adaptor subunit, partial [Candidatus Cloacimonetes bacterium]|nr:efflux RND transporter periplasmic adaptor subunit [Candidatus Cloacimonadota bacterium]